MLVRNIPWRFLLPGVIFPTSIAGWVRYGLSLRASDDVPVQWYWYGSPFSALLNFPAYVYSAPAQMLFRFGIRVGKLWIEPRIVTFFVLVIVFWYWLGTKIESFAAPRSMPPVREGTGRSALALHVLGAALWAMVALGTIYDLQHMVHIYGWDRLRNFAGDWELLKIAQLLWGVILAVYYCSRVARDLGWLEAGRKPPAAEA